jgi:BlaI family transcriptional regulator, penicillinase repressor
MARPKRTIPTPAEQHALNFLGERGSATVREYFEQSEANQGKAYTSVMSLLNVMFQKGLVTRTLESRAFRYKPTMTVAENRAAVVANVLEVVFEGDLDALKATVTGLSGGKRK